MPFARQPAAIPLALMIAAAIPPITAEAASAALAGAGLAHSPGAPLAAAPPEHRRAQCQQTVGPFASRDVARSALAALLTETSGQGAGYGVSRAIAACTRSQAGEDGGYCVKLHFPC